LTHRHHGGMNAYSEDLRKKIVQALRRGMGKSQAARTFSVSLSSVKRYAKLAEEGGSLAPKKRPNGSATTYAENCTPSESREKLPKRPRSIRVGASPTPIPQALRRAYRGRGEACGGASSAGSIHKGA
jgi:transposase-like protein